MTLSFLPFLICYMGYMWTLSIFCNRYLKGPKIHRNLLAVILFVGGLSLRAFFDKVTTPYITMATIIHILFIGFIFVAFREDAAKKLLVVILLITIKTFVWNFSGSFFSCLLLLCLYTVTDGRVTYISLEVDYLISAVAYCVVILAINGLKKRLIPVFENKIKSWYITVALPLFFLVVIVDVVNWGASNGVMVVSNASGAEYWNIYYNQFFSHTAICLLTALSMCIAGGLIFGMDRIYREQRQKEQYHSQIAFYKMQNEQYLQMERLRHDMKNHVLALHSLWETGDSKKLGNYLEKMLESGSMGESEELTGNRAIDVLLYQKGKKAKEKKIQWDCDALMLKNCTIDEFDLCVLLGNILDNAINASEMMESDAERFVHMNIQQVKKCLLIVAKNGTELAKTEEVKQGFGLLNVKETVRKYQGTINIKVENHVFEISLLIPMG